MTSLDMAPFYESLCTETGRPVSSDLLVQLKAANVEKLAKLEEAIQDSEKNFGETEQKEALQAKAEYLCRIGDKASPPDVYVQLHVSLYVQLHVSLYVQLHVSLYVQLHVSLYVQLHVSLYVQLHVSLYVQEAAESAFRAAYEKTVGLGYRMDLVFYLIRLGLFYMDHDLITRNIQKAQL